MKTRKNSNECLDLEYYDDEIIQDVFSVIEKTKTGDRYVWYYATKNGKRKVWG